MFKLFIQEQQALIQKQTVTLCFVTVPKRSSFSSWVYLHKYQGRMYQGDIVVRPQASRNNDRQERELDGVDIFMLI